MMKDTSQPNTSITLSIVLSSIDSQQVAVAVMSQCFNPAFTPLIPQNASKLPRKFIMQKLFS